jgi:uncharacterized protein DUF6247
MTGSWTIEGTPLANPLAAGASPAAIHTALDPEDKPRFLDDLDQATREMREQLDLTPVFSVLEEYRRLAILQRDRIAYHRTIRAAAAIATGEESPEDEPFEVTRQKAGFSAG